ncbi:MAG: hypothetical protein HC821_04195 [Lewinella sp.]|nr:hypothetical protein [Lewinella sp.]
MNKAGGPTKDFTALKTALEAELGPAAGGLDFDDTAKTFAHKSDAELLASARLFGLMRYPLLSSTLSTLGLYAVRWGLPGAKWVTKNTIYPQFVGGTSLLAAEPSIARLYERGVVSVLDYGVEAKSQEADFNQSMREVLHGIDFAAKTQQCLLLSLKFRP